MDELSNKGFNYKQFYIMSKIIARSAGNRFPLRLFKGKMPLLLSTCSSPSSCYRVGGRCQSDQGQGLLGGKFEINMLDYDMEERAKSHFQTQLLT